MSDPLKTKAGTSSVFGTQGWGSTVLASGGSVPELLFLLGSCDVP